MKRHSPGIAAALLLWLSACHGPNEPFATSNAIGSCQFTTSDGYDYCEDFLGNEYNTSIAQNTCDHGNGTWSPDACTTAGALGTCAIVIGTGDSQNIQYTYYPDSHAGTAPATSLTVETACGLAGGTFAAK